METLLFLALLAVEAVVWLGRLPIERRVQLSPPERMQ